MTRGDRAFYEHAQAVLEHELRRARGRLTSLAPQEQAVVAQVSARVTDALVNGVLDHARVDPRVAQALASIYSGGRPGLDSGRGS